MTITNRVTVISKMPERLDLLRHRKLFKQDHWITPVLKEEGGGTQPPLQKLMKRNNHILM